MNALIGIKKIFSKNAKKMDQKIKWGLCLSGGGMRGMAHIGVIKVFEEYGLYPDMIAGTSAGSIIGSAYALGKTADEMYEYFMGLKFKDIIKKNKSDIDKTNSNIFNFFEHIGEIKKSLTISFDGAIIQRAVHNLCEDKNFEDTLVPFYVVATDLAHVKEIVFQSGKLDIACRASSSIPGVFTPYCVDDMILVDGFVLNNLPANVLKERGAEIVISVNLKAFGAQGAKSAKFSDVVGTTIELMSNASSLKGAELSDLIIEPNLQNFGPYTIGDDNLKKMYELGYEAAIKKINDIKVILSIK